MGFCTTNYIFKVISNLSSYLFNSLKLLIIRIEVKNCHSTQMMRHSIHLLFLGSFSSLFIFDIFIIYLKDRITKRGRERESERERFFVHWFAPQMTVIARPGLNPSQESGTPSGSPFGVLGLYTWVIFLCFQRHISKGRLGESQSSCGIPASQEVA